MECEQSNAEHAADISAVYTSDRLQPALAHITTAYNNAFTSEHDSGLQLIQWENVNNTNADIHYSEFLQYEFRMNICFTFVV